MTKIGIDDLYFEDLEVGMRFESVGRTVTETDIVAFSGLSGDYTQLHTDREYAAATQHGERIAHGMLVLAVVSGLSTRVPLMVGVSKQIIGLLNLECKFKSTTKIGDTLHVVLTIEELRLTSKGDSGVMVLSRNAVNQKGVVVMESIWKLLIKTRQQGAA